MASLEQVMPERGINWTGQQKRAITEHARDVVVTASAGTGKTAVLSGSCVNLVSDSRRCPDIWNILVLTFTNMAAEEMRSRISQLLRDAAERTAEPALRRHLRHQVVLVDGAEIGTIHSFCKRLITEFHHKIDLDPTFSIIEADEATLLKAETLEKTIDWAWERPDLAAGLQQLFAHRNVRDSAGFLSTIVQISDYLDSVASRRDWYDRAAKIAQADPFATDLGEEQTKIIAGHLDEICARIRHAQALYHTYCPGGDWAGKCDREYLRPILELIRLFEKGNWDDFVGAVRNFERPTVRRPPDKTISKPTAELIQGTVSKAMDSVKGLRTLVALNPEYLERLGGVVAGQTRIVIELVRQFDCFYTEAKRRLNCLDFADLEHYAIKLLAVENKPSDVALGLRNRYKYIFVDEYQDINSVQKTILDVLSGGGNVFAVGDVKQSIYQWRGANPGIFLEALQRTSDRPREALGLRVDLNVNFRSDRTILDFVNSLFGRIMTAPFARLDYDESARLSPPADNVKPGAIGAPVELHILDKQQQDEDAADGEPDESPQPAEGRYNGRQLQAALIARRIRQMVGTDTGKAEFQIYDKQLQTFRDVRYGDIVILMRAVGGKADFVEVLQLAQIPVSSQTAAGYFETTEITDIICLLRILDNPRRDIELAAVLRSPLFSVSDTELAEVKLFGAEGLPGFFDRVLSYSQSGPDKQLARKLADAMGQIDRWRRDARRGKLADLIWRVYRQTGYLSFVTALPNGQTRKGNLLKLHERAIQFEGFVSSRPVPSLTRFIEFVEKLRQAGEEWSPAEPGAEAGNAVRVLSVHKSKGLEFPVVFIADLNTAFNRKDQQDDCLVDENLGLGLRIIDRDTNSKLDSLAHQVIKERKMREKLAEEMRILYVALTRARHRLILVGCEKQKTCRDKVAANCLFGEGALPDWQLRRCSSHLDWILSGLSHCGQLHETFQTGLEPKAAQALPLDVRAYEQEAINGLSQYVDDLRANITRGLEKPPREITNPRTCDETVAGHLTGLKQSLAWQYPFGEAPNLPAKRSVTQWTHQSDEFRQYDYSRALQRMPKAVEPGRPDSRTVGAAMHLVISQLDLAKAVTQNAVERLRDKLAADGCIPESVCDKIDAKAIVAFFETGPGLAALDKHNTLYREWPFTFAVPASEFPRASLPPRLSPGDAGAKQGDEFIIVQGIIDMLIQTPQGLLLVDFKTDHITADEAQRRAELYRTQLDLYARAASAILKSPLLRKYLYFLVPPCIVEL